MIELIPSLSILNGKPVRLSQGDYNNKVIYKESPLEVATRFEEHGVRRLHLIDLDGARDGYVSNYSALELIAAHTKLSIDFGGGIQTDGDVMKSFEFGAKMVTIGSVAATHRERVSSWLISIGHNKIILSADCIGREIAVRGRQKHTKIDLIEHIEYFQDKGLSYLKCADNSRDGMLKGPAFELYEELQKRFPNLKIMASGGVSSMDDVKRLNDIGLYGVIIGKAFYDGYISLKEMEKFIAKSA
jgi:phosphoribosylformimino-5-aminoimidazole carboxamide ribotide isomerase